ncbi:Talin-2 [Daphnia magna]|uniref:Talin-2 n=1 Tax=Daphnia magna TaxID=35525 RepID=A0A162STT1_9CRUS|nr:Talin-2 [Daphnia magna]
MASISLKISIVEKDVVKTMQFDPNTAVYDACRVIRDKITEANLGQPKDYGLFLADEDPKKGIWLEPGRNLGYYVLRTGDLLEYRRKMRTLKVRMLDGTVKTMLVDDSQPVTNLMVVICTKIGITNHDEYSLVRENQEEEAAENKPNFGTLTLRRKKEEKEPRDQKMEQLKKKIKTDDELNWVDHSKTLREQGIDENETVLLRRKYFFSDGNVDSRDPVQLNLLFVQARDSILNGTHPVTLDKACEFAGIQCQAQFGDYIESKHKPGFLDLKEFLPQSYMKVKGVEKKVFGEHKKHNSLMELESKVAYVKTARSLSTYGVTFFLVKEKMKGKNKLAPRLLGVTKDSVLRLDERTKEILKVWPLTTVRRWAASPNTFTLDFGDYSDQYYSVQTTEGEQISQLIAGYIDIILKKKQAKDHFGIEGDEGSNIVEDSVSPFKATIVQHTAGSGIKSGKVQTESVAKPAIVRAADVPQKYGVGQTQAPQLPTLQGLATVAHAPPTMRQNLLSAASKVGETTYDLLKQLGEADNSSRELQDMLLGLAKAVANTTAALVLNAKAVAAACPDETERQQVIAAATQCALATSQLVACAKVVAPTISDPACQQHLVDAAREVARAVEGILALCQQTCRDEKLITNLRKAAGDVASALNDLLAHIKEGTGRNRATESVHEGAVDNILAASDRLFAAQGNLGDAAEMVRQARVLAQATAQLIQAIKGEAEALPDSELQQRLLAAARSLAEATARMVEAAKACASSPNDANQQQKLRQAAEELRGTAESAAGEAIKKKVIKRLETAAKHAAATATQSIAAAQAAGPHNSNPTSQDQLLAACKAVADQIAKLVQGVKSTLANPESPASQLALISASEEFIQSGNPMVAAAKTALPTVNDPSSSMQLNNSSKQFSTALTDLRTAVTKARDTCGPLELDSALDMLYGLKEELDAFSGAVDASKLKPLPGETAESTAQQFSATSKAVGSNMAQLLTAVNQGDEKHTGMAARSTAVALQDLTDAVRGVAATSDQPEQQHKIIDSAKEVVEQAITLIEEARSAATNPQDVATQQRVTQIARDVSQSLSKCAGCLPGQKDVDEAIQSINSASEMLNGERYPRSDKSYHELQTMLGSAAADLNDAAGEVVGTARESPTRLAWASKTYSTSFCYVMNVGMEMAGQTKDTETRSQMIVSLKNITLVSGKLLTVAKTANADPSAPNAKSNLTAAARAVTEAINGLVDVCTASAPGQKECDNAVRAIQSTRSLLEKPNEPVNDMSYFECLDTVMEKSKSLGDGMTGIANNAKKSEHEPFGEAVKDVSNAITGLVEAAAQAAYLVGASDPSSVAGRSGLVDQAAFARASQAIQSACQALSSPKSTQQQVLSAATVIAKHTSSLCNACRVASSKTTNPVAKRHFVQSAKDVANSTAKLVKEIKALDQDYSQRNRDNCAAATQPLIEAVENLCTFANSPDFASIPAKISPTARQSQEPITSAGKSIIDGSCSMISAAKSLALNPKDPPTWQALANHSKSVSDSIKKLVSSIRDKAPGQKECDDVISIMSNCVRQLDQASLSAISQNLSPRREKSAQAFAEQTTNCAMEIADRIDSVRTAAKGEAEKLGHAVTQISHYFEPMVVAATGSASYLLNSKQQMMMLDQSKTVTECAIQLVLVAKEAGGNPKAVQVHTDLDESAEAMKEALRDLLSTVETVATEAGVVSGLVDSITASMNQMESRAQTASAGDDADGSSFVDYQTRMVQATKEIARLSQDMVAKSGSDNVSQLGQLGASITHLYTQLATDTQGAVAKTSSVEIAMRIKSTVHDLGRTCIDLVKAGGARQGAPDDVFTQRDLSDAARLVGEKASQVLAALQASSRGTQACINAASTVSGIIGDLDTTILFATAGTLHAENEDESFADHRENILKTAKALVEDTKTLVAGAASSQEQLAVAAQNAVATIVQLSDVVKLGAASLGSNNPEAQVMLINSVKDVASALGDLIHATKSASGKSINDPAMIYLKDSAKETDESLSFDEMILEAAKSIAAATSALVKAASAAQRELIDIGKISRRPQVDSDDGQWSEGLVSAARLVAAATHSLVESANALVQGQSSEDKLISAAKQVASSTAQLLVACKVKADPDSKSTQRLQAAGNAVKRATDNLVKAAQQAIAQEEERSLVVNRRMVGGIAQEIDARSEVLRIERELEEARSRLTAIRRAKYRGEGDSDAEGYMSGYDSSMETSGYRTNLNGSDIERSPAPPPQQTLSTFQAESRVRQVYQVQQSNSPHQSNSPQQQMYQHLQRDQRSVSPVPPPKKQPPATPPRLSSTQKPQQQQQRDNESPLMILQRQRHLLESTANSANNSMVEDHTPSFSESRQRFNNSSTFNSSVSMSSFQSPVHVQHGASAGGDASYYSATSSVRSSTEQIHHSQVTTQRTERVSMSSTSKVYQQLQEK